MRQLDTHGGTHAQAPVRIDRPREWRSRLLIVVSALLVFLTVSGLSIYLMPFGVGNQYLVLLHTILGVVFLVPFAWYGLRHWWLYRRAATTHFKVTGYLALALAIALAASGIVLTWQAGLGTRISYAWDLVHVIGTFALVPFLVLHVVLLWMRDSSAATAEAMRAVLAAERGYRWKVVLATVVPFLAMLGAGAVDSGYRWTNAFPEGYAYPYGENRPFAPSLATTDTKGAFDDRSLSGSERCGTAGCHEQIYKEWSVSSHRWSALDVAFQAIQKVMGEQNGPESTRYCGGCHDPVSLFSGAKNLYAGDLTSRAGYQEGVSCLLCHSIRENDLKGNANYVVTQPSRYLWELSDLPLAKFTSDFLIRAYPRQHVAQLSKRLFKTPEYCAACHKQFIDEEVNDVGWVQLQNQYDNWRTSRWNQPDDPEKTIECRECHMPLHDSTDPAAGDDADTNRSPDDGKHRSHRFLAANQLMPVLLELPGGEEQSELTTKWLRGEIEIPEIADKWKEGPAVPIEIRAPETARQGDTVPVQVVITSNKVGHDFPTGPLDIIQAWVEIVVKDDAGNVVFQSGTVDEKHFIAKGSFIFKAEAVDQNGNLIDRHNLWEMVGVRFKRALFPGFSDVAEYTVPCTGTLTRENGGLPDEIHEEVAVPEGLEGTLTIEAKLRYRKIDQYLLTFIFGEDTELTAPITDMSEDRATIRVVSEGAGEGPAEDRGADR